MPEEWMSIPVPLVAPFGIPVTSGAVRQVWDEYVKPMQTDNAAPQSIETRILMAILRAVHQGLLEAEEDTDD